MSAAAFERCIASGGLAVFPTDTVYGLACDVSNPDAVGRLNELKGRPPGKPAAVMFFDFSIALAELDELGPRTRSALAGLLPGGVTLLLPNPGGRYPLACGEDPSTVGLRVPDVVTLRGVRAAVLQSSANLAGGRDARRVGQVPEAIRAGADLVIDGGDLPGRPSTVVDLRRFEADGSWSVLRSGAVGPEELRVALRGR